MAELAGINISSLCDYDQPRGRLAVPCVSLVGAKNRDNTYDVTTQRHPIVRSAANLNDSGCQSERRDFRAAAIPAAAIVGCSKLGQCMTAKPCRQPRPIGLPYFYDIHVHCIGRHATLYAYIWNH